VSLGHAVSFTLHHGTGAKRLYEYTRHTRSHTHTHTHSQVVAAAREEFDLFLSEHAAVERGRAGAALCVCLAPLLSMCSFFYCTALLYTALDGMALACVALHHSIVYPTGLH
jgi:hypothetical protein